jgi:hypothetical protein
MILDNRINVHGARQKAQHCVATAFLKILSEKQFARTSETFDSG